MKTTRFELNVGVNSGYGHKNETNADFVPETWQECIEEVFLSTGILVGSIIIPSMTVYRECHGCPKGGEMTAIISGLRNPEFCQDDEKWRSAVRLAAKLIKKHYDQTTAYLSFSEVDFEYLKGE